MQLYRFTCCALFFAQLAQVALLEDLLPEFVCSDDNCYAVSWFSRRFAKSKGDCKGKNGDLMTMKNSVQSDAILKFMSKVRKEDVRVWIGLQLPSGTKCTDLQQPLRGFTWVTGDIDTNYTNWRNNEQKCDASPLCVTMHKDGTWEETKCDNKVDGYLCEISHSFSCSPVILPPSHSGTFYHPALGLAHSGDHVFPPGTIANISTVLGIIQLFCEGTETVAWIKKTPGAWSCKTDNGGCEHDCIEVSDIAECSCPPGSELKADLRSCTKPCDPNPCSQHCVLDSSPPEFFCMCSEGYILAADGKTCEDIDDCAANPNICEHHCTNTAGSFVCDCQPGFQMVEANCDPGDTCKSECLDIDECDSTICEHHCENSLGSYRCYCNDGYVVDENDAKKCKQFCNVSFCNAECHGQNKSCTCPQGYIWELNEDVSICIDIDECDASPCDRLSCINTFGSYLCTCPEGYAIDNGTCIQPTTTVPSDVPMDTLPTSRPEDIYTQQTTVMWGICSGLLSMVIVLIAMLCHRIRRHYVYQHDLDYNYKNTDKYVVLQKVMMEPQWQL